MRPKRRLPWLPYIRTLLLLIFFFMMALAILNGENLLIRIESATL